MFVAFLCSLRHSLSLLFFQPSLSLGLRHRCQVLFRQLSGPPCKSCRKMWISPSWWGTQRCPPGFLRIWRLITLCNFSHPIHLLSCCGLAQSRQWCSLTEANLFCWVLIFAWFYPEPRRGWSVNFFLFLSFCSLLFSSFLSVLCSFSLVYFLPNDTICQKVTKKKEPTNHFWWGSVCRPPSQNSSRYQSVQKFPNSPVEQDVWSRM